MAVNHFTASGIVTSYHVPIAFPALVYGGPSSTPNTPTGPHGSAKPCGLVFLYARGHGGLTFSRPARRAGGLISCNSADFIL